MNKKTIITSLTLAASILSLQASVLAEDAAVAPVSSEAVTPAETTQPATEPTQAEALRLKKPLYQCLLSQQRQRQKHQPVQPPIPLTLGLEQNYSLSSIPN